MRIVVGMADMRLSMDPGDFLITYALGSCIAVTLHDPLVRAGGLLHYMLPESSLDPSKAKTNPWMFADTGIPLLLEQLGKLGAGKDRLRITAVGGSQVMDDSGYFNIGKRNYQALRRIFQAHRLGLHAEMIGGFSNRTVRLEIATGRVWVKTAGNGETHL